MQFKNHRSDVFRLASLDGHTLHFEPGETRAVPDALSQTCIEAGLTPVEEKKPAAKAAGKSE